LQHPLGSYRFEGEYWELQTLIQAFGSFHHSPVIWSLVLPDVPYGMRAFVRILLLFLLILCLYMPRLLACTRYIVDCEPSWLLISLLHLQLVDYMLYSENSYINNRCAIRCASFPHNRLWAPISCYLLVVVTVARTAVTALLVNV